MGLSIGPSFPPTSSSAVISLNKLSTALNHNRSEGWLLTRAFGYARHSHKLGFVRA